MEHVNQNFDDATHLIDLDIDAAVSKFTERLLIIGESMKNVIVGKEKSQPWFDNKCKETSVSLLADV